MNEQRAVIAELIFTRDDEVLRWVAVGYPPIASSGYTHSANTETTHLVTSFSINHPAETECRKNWFHSGRQSIVLRRTIQHPQYSCYPGTGDRGLKTLKGSGFGREMRNADRGILGNHKFHTPNSDFRIQLTLRPSLRLREPSPSRWLYLRTSWLDPERRS